MAKEFTIKKGHRLWLGNYPVLLMDDVDVVFETVVDSPDVMAEVLASNPAMYAGHKDDLAHDEDGFENVNEQRMQADGKTPVLGPMGQPVYDIVAKPVKVHVTYGLNGQRIEHKPGDDRPDVKKQTAEQKKSVEAADKQAAVDAKKLESQNKDLVGTSAETVALLKEEEKRKADAKGLADADARRKLEIAEHGRPGGSPAPII